MVHFPRGGIGIFFFFSAWGERRRRSTFFVGLGHTFATSAISFLYGYHRSIFVFTSLSLSILGLVRVEALPLHHHLLVEVMVVAAAAAVVVLVVVVHGAAIGGRGRGVVKVLLVRRRRRRLVVVVVGRRRSPSCVSSESRRLRRRELHPLLLLALVAEPHADLRNLENEGPLKQRLPLRYFNACITHHVLLEVQLLGDGRDLLPAGPWLDGEVGLERPLLRRRDGGPLPLLLARREDAAGSVRVSLGRLRLVQPGRQHRLQGNHVVVA